MMEVEMSDRLDSGEDFAVKGGDEAASGNETKEANTAEGGTVAVPEDALPMAQGMGGGAALWWNESESTQKIYVDHQFFLSFQDQVSALRDSTTVYIGNLSFLTTEAQIYELCSLVGPVKRVIMGLNRNSKTPCGFCFVEHYTAEAALENVARVTGLVLDGRILRSELDFGFREGRQYGRGQSGGQVRDDRRFVYDSARSNKRHNKDAIVPNDDPDARAKAEQRKRRFAGISEEDANKDDSHDQVTGQEDQAAETQGAYDASDTTATKRRRHNDDDEEEDEDDEDN